MNRPHIRASFRLAAVLCALAWVFAVAAPARAARYFDAHNHISGILPYYAYADLPAFIAGFSNPAARVSAADRLALFRYLTGVWYPAKGAALDHKLFSPPDGQRFALGARAALVVYGSQVAGSVAALDGALERVLTATPWSEFDSAYAFRGGPAWTYLRDRFYAGSGDRLNADLCKATILELAATNVDDSEQSLPFLGGWKLRDGRSAPLDTILCVMRASSDPNLRAALHAMSRPMPSIKIVLMTHTAQLAASAGGASYDDWSKTGLCAPVPLPQALVTTPKSIYDALMGWSAGKAVVPRDEAAQYFGEVTGIDTAAPETTCFTSDGMQYYSRLIEAVYDASKARRLAGWNGKLLVHTHVGEGATIDYVPAAPPQPWDFERLFAAFPAARTSTAQARANISTLLAAIAAFERAHADAHQYVVFRLAHDTWATPEQAAAMRDEGVEADVNLESNVATGAYPIARMPLGAAALAAELDPVAANPATNFELNDLLGTLVKDPTDASQVGPILGDASLKYLLEARVRCLLGSDAGGVEHSDIVKEYEYASSLIAYWNRTDPAFASRSGGATTQRLFDDVRWHLASMASDGALPY
ncbi:MAG: hypothetical protein WA814_07550 [Candidatus Baltobacteraceae bacterium]